jgi:Na+/melibiose symporter-like transporter
MSKKQADSKKPEDESKLKLGEVDQRAILEHARTNFHYHAGQRLQTLRYFFVTYGVLFTAYLSATGVGVIGRAHEPYQFAQLIVSITMFIFTLAFWGLDRRNSDLVHIDENAMKELEAIFASRYGLKKFTVTENRERKGAGMKRYVQYRIIVNWLFLIMSLTAFWLAWRSTGINLDFMTKWFSGKGELVVRWLYAR